MAAKRFLGIESGSDPDQPSEKRMRTRPSFAAVIEKAVMMNSLQHFCLALEPLLRRVVNEELENTLKRCSRPFTKSPSLRIQAPEPSTLQLIFSKKLLLPIFTGSKILDTDGGPLQVLLVDTNGDQLVPTSLPHPIKVEIVVLDGDFPSDDRNTWTSDQFNNNVVRERTGKRPLLAGDCLTISLRDGFAPVGDIEFTDNSSWIRCRKFRLGARVASGSYQGVKIRQAITEAFVVKDHRGELYKKHHPPSLEDDVWRLEKIGKDGAFHKKLAHNGINTVQDFLKLSTVDPQKLRRILGPGMSERMWDVTIKHARTCIMGNKHYILRHGNSIFTLNPISQIVNATINGQTYSTGDLSNINRSYMEAIARKAYLDWSSLEEIVGISSETPLLTQGELVDEYPNPNYQQQAMVKSIHFGGYSTDRYIEMGNYMGNNNANPGCTNWQITSTYHGLQVEPGMRYITSESSSSDGELASSRF